MPKAIILILLLPVFILSAEVSRDEGARKNEGNGSAADAISALVSSQQMLDSDDTSAPLEALEGVVSANPDVRDYLNFNLAKLYLKRGMTERALQKIESIKEETSGSYFKYRVLREKALIYEKSTLYGKEALTWGQIGLLENIGRQKKKEALFKEASAWERSGASARAKRIYKEIAFDFSPNPFGSRALIAYIALGAGDYPPGEMKAKEEMIIKLLNCGRAEDALSLLKLCGKNKENGPLLAQILYKARKNGELFAMADEAMQKSSSLPGEKIIVLKALWATLRTNDGEKCEKYFNWLNNHIDVKSPISSEINYAKGCFLFVNGKFKECAPFFDITITDKTGPFYFNALFKKAMAGLVAGETTENPLSPLLEKKNDFEERSRFSQKKWYGQTLVPLPSDSYYGAISDAAFGEKARGAFDSFENKQFAGRPGRDSLAYKLYSAGFPLFALDQMEKTGCLLTKENAYTKMMLLSEIGELCFEIPGDFDYRLGLSHPTPWRREIMLAAKEEGVDPALLFAIARRESRFDPLAYSGVGAVGLFQLMPETARRFSQNEIKEEDLLDPLTNARIAARYLKELGRLFPNKAEIAASYNAGEECVSVWRKSFGDDETVFTLMIPYYETQEYTEGVLFDIAVYSERLKNLKDGR
jgi:hypothetical protein